MDFAGRVNENVPQTHIGIKLAQQKHFDAGARLLLVAEQTSGEYLCVVEQKNVVFIEEIDDVFEQEMLNFAAFAMDNHQFRFVAMVNGFHGNAVLRQFVLELGELHIGNLKD